METGITATIEIRDYLTGTTRSVVGVLAETAWQKCTGNMLKKEAAKYNNAMVKKIKVATSTR